MRSKANKRLRYQIRKSKRALRNKIEFVSYILRKRKSLIGKSEEDIKHALRFKGSMNIIPNKNFSFIENVEEFVKTINILQNCLQNKQKVNIRLSKIDTMTPDAIVVLLSILDLFNKQSVYFTSDTPSNSPVRNMFESSGLAEHLYGQIRKFAKKGRNSIMNLTNNNVDSAKVRELIGEASETIWGEKKECVGAYRVLIECMTNTIEHADIERKGKHNWWISVFHKEEDKTVSFSILDYGMGIFKNMKTRKGEVEYNSFFKRFKSVINTNADTLELILNGELKNSSMGQRKNRGNGLPSIKKALDLNQISEAIIISNDAFADLKQGNYKKLKNYFKGTFVYFELNYKCRNKKWATFL